MDKSKSKKFFSKTFVVCIGALICCALWGSAFPVIKLGYNLFQIESSDSASQILFAGIRFTTAGVLTVIFSSIISKKLILPNIKALPKISVLALFQTIIQYVFFYIGLAYTTGTKASIINSVGVFFAVLISSLLFRQEKLTVKKVSGCILGFMGVVLINFSSTLDFTFTLKGEGFIVICAVSYAFSTVLIRSFSQTENPVMLSGYQFILGGIVMTVAGFAMGGGIENRSVKGIVLLVYLSLVSAVAYTLWGVLLKYNSVSKVSIFGFMTQVFGCAFSIIILGESIADNAVKTLASLILVCVGIFIVNKSNKNKV